MTNDDFEAAVQTNMTIDYIAEWAPLQDLVPYGSCWFGSPQASWLVSLGSYLVSASGTQATWTEDVLMFFKAAYALGFNQNVERGVLERLKLTMKDLIGAEHDKEGKQ